MLGSIIPISLIAAAYYYVIQNVSGKTGFYFIEMLPFNPFIWQLSGIILLFGAGIGMLGSMMSIRKFLKV